MRKRILWYFIFCSVMLIAVFSVYVWAEDSLSPHEERLYRLFDSHLSFLNTLLIVFGGTFVFVQIALQLMDWKRQRSSQMYFDNFINASNQLIGSTKHMIELANSGQEEIKELKDKFARLDKQKTDIFTALILQLLRFENKYHRFNIRRS